MEHILSIAFDFDDNAVKQKAQNAVENEMDKIIKDIVLNKIAPMESGWYGKQERNWNNFHDKINNAVENFLEEHREEIIELAAQKLLQSVSKTKLWKERYSEILNGVGVE